MEFSHFDQKGNAIMVDVSSKNETKRTAIATGSIQVNQEIITKIQNQTMKKGDVLGVARIAGIMATKRTSELIPLCHPILINKVEIDFSIDETNSTITTTCLVGCTGQTGVEMEALQGVTTTLLTIYDMCKAVSKEMEIKDIHLCKKSGGKSGDFRWKEF